MVSLDDLIQADTENIQYSRKILAEFDPKLSAALDSAAVMFDAFSESSEGVLDDSADLATLDKCSRELGVDEHALGELIKSEAEGNAALETARTARFSYFGRRARGTIFLLLRRQYRWGATDLLRMRLTPAIGYGRQQAESVGLLLLMKEDPKIAYRWLRISSTAEGISFHKSFNMKILKAIEPFELRGAYEMGSGISLHVRPMSAIQGLSLNHEPIEKLEMCDQEVRVNDPFSFFLETLHFLTVQQRVFRALTDAFPEVKDPDWPERVRIFAHTIDSIWGKLRETYPKRWQEYLRMAQAEERVFNA